jgi:peptidoglycan hydrolase-like protein with peptidoglycan-binding domain
MKNKVASNSSHLTEWSGQQMPPKDMGMVDIVSNPVVKNAEKAGVGIAKSAEQATAQVAAKVGAKGMGKIVSKMLPGVGLLVGTYDAIRRAKEGDWLGAGLAGASAALSLVPGIGGFAAMGLDAANIGRDIKAGKFKNLDSDVAPELQGSTGSQGDTKLKQLQKMIGANPDGIMGPETKSKLQAWQQQQGIKADGLPGPETYGKAGISESQQTVAEGIRSLQERLQLIESKAIIRESLEQTYYFDGNFFIYNSLGEQVTDLTTISVINEAYENGEITLAEVSPGILSKLNPFAFMGGLRRGAGTVAKSGEQGSKAVARLANRVGGAKGAGLKSGAAIARNPIKTAAAASAIGGGLGYGLSGGGGLAGPEVSPSPPYDTDDEIKQPEIKQPEIKQPETPVTPDAPAQPELDSNELEELHKLARYIGKYSDPISAELMGQYNTILPNLPKAKEIPGEMDESIVERYFRKINRKY